LRWTNKKLHEVHARSAFEFGCMLYSNLYPNLYPYHRTEINAQIRSVA
jgi:hypothetical protein